MGQAKIRKNAIEQLKVALSDRKLYSNDLLEISEILDLNQKKDWMGKYKNAYSGLLKSVCDPHLYGQNVRFIKASINGESAGFIRINDKSSKFSLTTKNSIWNITDGFVESRFRRMDVMKRLIQFSVEHLGVKMFYMEKQRYLKISSYYTELGFTRFIPSSNGLMIWGLQTDMESLVPNSHLAH